MTRSLALVLLLATPLACGSRTDIALAATQTAAGADASVDAPPTPPCGPGTCPGCCDEQGSCQLGSAVAACGVQGRACRECDARYELCRPDPTNPGGQVCFSPCNFQGCIGRCCLSDGTCVSGDTDTACGNAATLCADCTATGQVCDLTGPLHVCGSP